MCGMWVGVRARQPTFRTSLMNMKLFRIVLVLAGLLFVGSVGVIYAAGTGPADALVADGAPQTVAPHSGLWYRVEYEPARKDKDATITLDAAAKNAANGAAGLRLAIYTPEQIGNWIRGDELTAIGNGSKGVDHDLIWSGRFQSGQTLYAVVYNDTDAPITVMVNATGAVKPTTPPPPTPTPLPNPFHEDTPVGKGVSGKIAFLDAQGGNLYTVNGDGTGLQRVSFGMDPQWNHAGNQIALARQGPVPGIFLINADGSNERLLYNTTEPRSPDWSPDDGMLVFSRQTDVKGGGQICFRGRCFTLPTNSIWHLGLLNTSDGHYNDLPTTDHAFTPTWSNDPNLIVYNDTTLGLVKTSPDDDPSLEPFVGDLRPGVGSYDPLKILSPQFSPDGKQIVMMMAQPPTWQIGIVNTDGSNRHLLTQMDNLDFAHPSNVAPVWSPDGKQIMFLSDRNGKWEIFVMNADGSNVQQVLKNVTDQIPLTYSYSGERMLSWK